MKSEAATLTKGRRADIERRIKVGGGISRSHARMLLDHIDRLRLLLDEVLTNGEEWGDEQWTVFTDQALLLVDEKSV